MLLPSNLKVEKGNNLMPLISLCVTVYNLENYISECLESILTQDFDDYEVVVVDNGSDDKSVEICERYASLFPDRMRYIKLEKPTVLGRATEVALIEARGVYIQTVDGDDYLASDYLINVGKIIHEKNPDVIMNSYQCVVEEGAIAINDAIFDPKRINDVPKNEALDYLFEIPNFSKVMWRFMVKRKFIGKAVDSELVGVYGDMVVTSFWLFSAELIYFHDGPCYFYRCRAGGNMSTQKHLKTTGGFLKALIQFQNLCNEVYSNQDKIVNQEPAKSMIDNLIKLFAGGSDLIELEEVRELASLLERYKMCIESLSIYKNPLVDELLYFIRKYGNFEGLMLFLEYCQINKINTLKDIFGKKIYVFPMGIYGGGVARALKKWKFDVCGFLDNDITKNGKTFNDITCFSPTEIADLHESEKVETIIVISTIYSNLVPTLEKQIIDLGYSNIKVV